MSKIHILESDGNFGYKIAIHFPTPTGNNTVGKSWKECRLANGQVGPTILKVGTNPSNITQAEYDSIIAGDIVEIIETVLVGVTPTNAAVDALADIRINAWQMKMAQVLKYYGYVIEGE